MEVCAHGWEFGSTSSGLISFYDALRNLGGISAPQRWVAQTLSSPGSGWFDMPHKSINKTRLLTGDFFLLLLLGREHEESIFSCLGFCPCRFKKRTKFGSSMKMDGLWTVLVLLVLSSWASGNQVSGDALAAPRVFVSFKGKTSSSPFANLRVSYKCCCFTTSHTVMDLLYSAGDRFYSCTYNTSSAGIYNLKSENVGNLCKNK